MGSSPHINRQRKSPIGTTMTTTKICSRCKQEKQLSEYSSDKRLKDGKKSYCIDCNKLRLKEWRSKNKEHVKAYTKNNSNKIKEYYLANKEKIDSYRQKYFKDNAIEIKKKKAQYYYNNYEKLYSIRRTEHRKILSRNVCNKRRSKINCSAISKFEIKKIIDSYKNCYWCNCELNGKYHIDHYIPLSKGGEHSIENIVISCPKCNLSKNAKNPYEYANSIGMLL